MEGTGKEGSAGGKGGDTGRPAGVSREWRGRGPRRFRGVPRGEGGRCPT